MQEYNYRIGNILLGLAHMEDLLTPESDKELANMLKLYATCLESGKESKILEKLMETYAKTMKTICVIEMNK